MRVPARLLLTTALLLAPTAFAGGKLQATQRGYFISVDGLQPLVLEGLTAQGVLTEPNGLGWLREHSVVVDRANPVVTLTAASHVSTVTCSAPSRHGIVANNYIREGKKVSGYMFPFTAEPLWRAAMRQGKKVLALAYVGADATTPERTADYSLAYPSDSLIAPGQSLTLKLADLPAAQGWKLPDVGTNFKETTVRITLNPLTSEARDVNVLIGTDAAGKTVLWLDDDKDTTNGTLGTLGGAADIQTIVNAYFTETNEASTIKGAKRRTFFRLLTQPDATQVGLYVSKASYNNAYPVTFREELDKDNLVWPDYGIHAAGITSAEFVTGQLMIDTFLTDVAVQYTDKLGIDVLFYYNPIIDTLGHSYQAKLPQPINATATDEVTVAFVRGFRQVDKNISRVLAKLGPQDVVALMGDHGMESTPKQVNAAAVITPEQVAKIEVVTSGAMMLIYPKQTGDDTPEGRAQAAEAVGQALNEKLQATALEGRPVFGKAFHKSDFQPAGSNADYKTEWQYGEALWVFTSGATFWYTFNPLNHEVFLDAPALGMHGHDVSVPSMATQLLIHGPGVAPRHIPTGSLIDAAPTFSKLLGIDPPANCLGHPIF